VRVRVWTFGCGARSMLDLCAIVLMGQVDCYVGGHAAMISVVMMNSSLVHCCG